MLGPSNGCPMDIITSQYSTSNVRFLPNFKAGGRRLCQTQQVVSPFFGGAKNSGRIPKGSEGGHVGWPCLPTRRCVSRKTKRPPVDKGVGQLGW